MFLLLLRHPESLKNINKQFSSQYDDENLTEKGKHDSLQLAIFINQFIENNNLFNRKVYSANSVRSLDFANIIANQIKSEVVVCDELRSTKPGALTGKTEAEAKATHPKFLHQLYLYRAGLFNSYDFIIAENKEPKKDFEKRVLTCLNTILDDNKETLKIIIAHRASLTTILIDFARRYYNYPYDFAGYINLDLAHLSVLEKRNDKWNFIKVNSNLVELKSEFNIM